MLVTNSQVSPPKQPAFIVSAPPIEPGIPEKNAAGPKLFFVANIANSKQETPASTLQVDSSIKFRRLNDFLVDITAPLIPPSLTKTFVPFPSQVIPPSLDPKKSESSLRVSGEKKISAGPPTFQDVCLAKGSF